jgi:hypothetical protein
MKFSNNTNGQYIYSTLRCYAARQRERLAMCFESFEEAKLRHQEQGSPFGNLKNMDYTGGTIVNWSELARRYQVKNKNGDCT